MLARPRSKAYVGADVSEAGSASIPNRRVVVLLDLLEPDLKIQWVVRVCEHGTKG